MTTTFHHPLAGDRWKTGQRVPTEGFWIDQHRTVTYHEAHRTFPPCVGRKGEVAYRTLLHAAATA